MDLGGVAEYRRTIGLSAEMLGGRGPFQTPCRRFDSRMSGAIRTEMTNSGAVLSKLVSTSMIVSDVASQP